MSNHWKLEEAKVYNEEIVRLHYSRVDITENDYSISSPHKSTSVGVFDLQIVITMIMSKTIKEIKSTTSLESIK